MHLHDNLDYSAREHPDAVFAEFRERQMSYREAAAAANQMANALLAAGLTPGDRFAVLSKNSIELVLLYYAGSKVGAVPVPLNFRLAPPEWAYIVRDAGVRMLFAQEALAAALEPVRSELSDVKQFVALDGEPAGYTRLESFVSEQSATRRAVVEADAAEEAALNIRDAVVFGKAFVEEGVVSRQQLENASIALQNACHEQLSFADECGTQRFVIVRIKKDIRFFGCDIPQKQPLRREVGHHRSGARVREHTRDLCIQNLCFAKPSCDRKLKQFIVRDAAPEEERYSGRQLDVADGGNACLGFGFALDSIEKLRTDEQTLQRKLYPRLEAAFRSAGFVE
jgi:hypothetical protein